MNKLKNSIYIHFLYIILSIIISAVIFFMTLRNIDSKFIEVKQSINFKQGE